MTSAFPSWVREAAALPVGFAQVREDPLLDLWVVNQLAGEAHVIMIASGGCSAAILATSPKVTRLHMVDPNPAQLALSRLKLRLLATTNPATRIALLGHAPMPTAERQKRLKSEWVALSLPIDALGTPAFVARIGPDHVGRYECVFDALRKDLSSDAATLAALLQLHDPAEQQLRVAPSTKLGRRLDEALDSVMALPNLVRLFGEKATKNPVESFSRHFARRLRCILAAIPADRNPYLWQMLKGCYPKDSVSPWLTEAKPNHMPKVTSSGSPMAEALAEASGSFDLVLLSNILDWLSVKEARATLALAWEALRPGGLIFIRQLNSDLDIPSLESKFTWLTAQANDLHARDRSFFYRALHLGRKG
ncbi:MAG TPA: DUF3419 family protein [Verrucomicrobiales bacterium]|nr:DUF3419 family protein [Verrucomicrobiales bacterium]